MIGRKSLIVPIAAALLLASGTAPRAEDFGKTISSAFTDAYEGLRDGILGAYETSRKGAVETFGDAKREANQAWQEHGPTSKPAASADGALVSSLQTELAAAGYDPGPADGRYGPRTADAIRSFQRNNALPEDGQATAALLEIMRAKRASAAPTPPTPGPDPASAALPRLPGGQTAQNPPGGAGVCRPFEQRTVMDGKETTTTGMACLQPNGTWKTVN